MARLTARVARSLIVFRNKFRSAKHSAIFTPDASTDAMESSCQVIVKMALVIENLICWTDLSNIPHYQIVSMFLQQCSSYFLAYRWTD